MARVSESWIIPVMKVQEGVRSSLFWAQEILEDAKILLQAHRISAFSLIILSLEEIGKAVLLWKHSKNFTKDIEIKHPKNSRAWFKYHRKKLDAAFWFHRGMVDLKDLGIKANNQVFLKKH